MGICRGFWGVECGYGRCILTGFKKADEMQRWCDLCIVVFVLECGV